MERFTTGVYNTSGADYEFVYESRDDPEREKNVQSTQLVLKSRRGKDAVKNVITPKVFRTPLDLWKSQISRTNSIALENDGRAKAIVLVYQTGLAAQKPLRVEIFWTSAKEKLSTGSFGIDAEAMFRKFELASESSAAERGTKQSAVAQFFNDPVNPLHPLDWLEWIVRRNNYGLVPEGNLSDIVTPVLDAIKDDTLRSRAIDAFTSQNTDMRIMIRLPRGASPVATQSAGVAFAPSGTVPVTAMLTSNNQLIRFRVVSSQFALAQQRKVAVVQIRDVEVLPERPTAELSAYRNTATAARTRTQIASERMDFKNAPLADL